MMKLLSLIGISSGCIVMGLVFTMVNTAIPVIQRVLGVPISEMQWMMIAFGIINCALLVTSGRLADILGRKKVFLVGLCFSGAGMLLGGWSSEGKGLILSMSLAGIGNAILLPVSQAMLVSEYPVSLKSRAIAIWATAIASAMAIGPLLGGFVSDRWGWKWVFWSLVPMVVLSLILTTLFSKESRNEEDLPLVDYKGMILIGVGLSAFALLVTEYAHFTYPIRGALLLVSLLSLFGLWKNSRSFPAPILLPELVKQKVFLAASIASGCLIFYIWSAFFLFPLFLQNVSQLSSFEIGLMMLAVTIPVAVLSPIVGKVYQPQRGWIFIFVGFLFLLISSILQRYFDGASSSQEILLAFTLFGIGYGLIMGPTATMAISVVSPNRAGIASGTFVTFQEIGGTLGLAFVVTTVRLNPQIELGYQEGMISLIIASILGCFCGLLLRRRGKKTDC